MAHEGKLIDTSKATLTNSTLRISLTRRIAKMLDAYQGDIIGFYQKDDQIYIAVVR
ncbi:hypothetical protein [Thermoplasma acidophilum]|uniref:hypothetical protein n=1 Tax=Thermoplasma acidophilum TaxID=2303 RepID=UPI0012E9A375|nr:hypothetical protein [Thermoplasma acidophilum]